MFSWTDDVDEAHVAAVSTALNTIPGKIDVLRGYRHGPDVGISDGNFDYVVVDEKFFRPAEVDLLIGDPKRAHAELNWEPETTFEGLCQMMVSADVDLLSGKLKGLS